MSQFDGLLDLKKGIKPKPSKKPKTVKKNKTTPPLPKKKNKEISVGKSNKDSEFVQTSIYVKKDTQISVKAELLTDHKKRDFSDLVQELLDGWLKNKN
jgi:glucan-binding YG repeat protein